MKTRTFKKIFYLFIVITAVMVISLNLSACKTLGESIIDTETFVVTKGDIIQIISASGYIDSKSEYNFSLSTAGKVIYTLKEGDTFKKGSMLFQIDDSRQELLVAQAEENLNISRSSLELARLNYQQALDANHVAVQLAETNTELAEQATQNALKSLEGANDIAAKSIESARVALEISQEIYEEAKGSLTLTDLQKKQYETNIASAEAAYESAKAQANSSQKTAEGSYDQSVLNQSSTYWTNLSSLQAAEGQIAITANTIDQAEKQLKLSEISVELVKMDSEDFTLYAPYDGIVTSSGYSEGEYASPGVPVISIISSDFIVKSEINETDVVNLEVGQDVEITLDAYYEHSFSGEIINISPVSTNVGGVVTFEITVGIETGNGPEILYGMSASLDITTSRTENVLYVPIQYVYEEDGISYIDVLTQDGETVKTKITTGTSNYDYIEIKSGLSEGDTVKFSQI